MRKMEHGGDEIISEGEMMDQVASIGHDGALYKVPWNFLYKDLEAKSPEE